MLKVSDSTLLELDLKKKGMGSIIFSSKLLLFSGFCVALSVLNVSLTATAKMFPVFEGLGFCCQLDTLI